MGKLSEMLTVNRGGRLSNLLGKEPSQQKYVKSLSQVDLARAALEQAEQEKDDREVKIDLSKPRSPEEEVANQARVDDFRQREQSFKEYQFKKPSIEEIIRDATTPGKSGLDVITKTFTKIPKILEGAIGQKPVVTPVLESSIASAVKAAPLVGGLAVSDEKIQELKRKEPSLGTFKEGVPLVGGKDFKISDVAGVAANVGFTAAQYGAVNKYLEGVNATSKLGSLLGKSKLSKFVATQGVDLLADVIIQTPQEVFSAIKNDDSLGEFAKTTLNNRAWDLAINAIVGGAMDLASLKKLKSQAKTDKKAFDEALSRIDPEQANEIRKTLEVDIEVPLSPSTKMFVPEPKKQFNSDDLMSYRTVELYGEPYILKGKDGNNYKATNAFGEDTLIPIAIADDIKPLSNLEVTDANIKRRANELLADSSESVKGQSYTEGYNKSDVLGSNVQRGENGDFVPSLGIQRKKSIQDLLDKNFASTEEALRNRLKRISDGKSNPSDYILKDYIEKNLSETKNIFSDSLKNQKNNVDKVKNMPAETVVEPKKRLSDLLTQETKQVDGVKIEKPTVEYSELDKKIKDLDIETKNRLDQVKRGEVVFGKEMADKRIKAIVMEQASKKRELIQGDSFIKVEGGLTSKELSNKIAKEKTNYAGKPVKTPLGDGKTIGKSSFGRVGVEFPDGTIKYIDSDDVKPKTSIDELINRSKKSNVVVKNKPKQIKSSPIIPELKKQPKPVVKKTELPKLKVSKTNTYSSPRISDFEEPVVGKSKSPFIDRIKDIVSGDPTISKLKRDLENLDLTVTSNEARTQAAKEIVSQDFDNALKLVKEGDRFGSTIESEIGREIVDSLNKSGRNAEAIEVIAKMSEKFRSAGKDVQAASIWSKTSPVGMQKWATDTLTKADVKVDDALIKEVGDDMRRIQDMSIEELAKMVADKTGGNKDRTLKAIEDSFSYDQLKAVNTAITMNKVIGKIPVLKARKISSLQAMSHLLNVKTFNRNILGNAASLMGESLSKYPASVADRALSMVTGKRSVVGGVPTFKKNMLEGWNQGKRSFFEIKAGVGKGKTGKYEALFGDTFKSKPGKFGERVMSWSLQTPDEFFKGFSKADSLYNQLSARLGPEVKKWKFDEIMNKATMEEIDTAIKEAEFATFQNDSFLADVFSKTKKGLNGLSTGAAKRVPGLNKLFSKDFGLGDMVIKYTRVPGNIMTRGFEYSPLGYYKAGEGLFKMMSNLDKFTPQQQRELALQIGRATTGTGLFLLGKKLNDLGIITNIDSGTDYNAQAFERAEGLGSYKVNINAIERLVKGENPTRQEGDTLKSFNWAAPMITPIAVGAKLGGEGKSLTDVGDVALGTWEQAMDLPSLFIAKQMMYESMREGSNVYDIASVPLKEAIPGFVPSAARQSAQLIDPVYRDSSGGANVPFLKALNPIIGEKAAGKIQANLPVFSKQLPEKLDVLGRTQERKKGIIPNLIDPATTTTFTPTAFGDKIRQVEKLTGESNFFPDRKPPNSISFKGEKINLTPKEKEAWQMAEGQNIEQLYTDFLEGVDINEENAFVIADRLSKIKGIASKIAKSEFLESRFGGE